MEQLAGLESIVSEWFAVVAPNRFAQALIIAVAFLLIAKVVEFIVSRVVRGWATRTRYSFDDNLVDILHKPLFISIVLLGLALAALRLQLPDQSYRLIYAVLATIGILYWAGFVAKFARLVLAAVGARASSGLVQERTLPLFNNLVSIVVMGLALYLAFLAWDIDVTAWVASAGIIGLAVSFAAKDTLANLFSGVFIMADAPYKIGDFIVLDSGERGMVTHIGIRSTRLLTRDDVEITVPNSVMGNAKITNEAGGPHTKYRVRVPIGVAYGSDVDQVRATLIDVAAATDLVCKQPDPRVRFRRFGDSSLEFELLCWIDEPVLRGRALDALNTAVYKRFMTDQIEIPFPQRDVHVHGLAEGAVN